MFIPIRIFSHPGSRIQQQRKNRGARNIPRNVDVIFPQKKYFSHFQNQRYINSYFRVLIAGALDGFPCAVPATTPF
jgi:hypothetical protein